MQHDPVEVNRQDRIRLMHMLDAARRVIRYCEGMTAVSLGADEMRLLAVVKSIEVIGEASTKVSDATMSRIHGVDWLGMKRMRNRMIHGYDTIDVARVWDAVELDTPALVRALETALASWPTK